MRRKSLGQPTFKRKGLHKDTEVCPPPCPTPDLSTVLAHLALNPGKGTRHKYGAVNKQTKDF